MRISAKAIARGCGCLSLVFAVVVFLRGGWIQGQEILGVNVPIYIDAFAFLSGLFLLLAPDYMLGLFNALLPERAVKVLAALLPGKLGEAPVAGPDPKAIDPTRPEALAEFVRDATIYQNKRYYRTLAIFFVVLPLIPLASVNLMHRSDFAQAGSTLAAMVQESRISFENGDAFRLALRRAKDAVARYSSTKTSTSELFRLLGVIYQGELLESAGFNGQLLALCEHEVPMENRQLVSRTFLTSRPVSALEDQEVRVGLLTLLAISCHEAGDQGRFVLPYLKARQLLREAASIADQQGLRVPGTYNALGVNYGSCLKAHGSYASELNRQPDLAKRLIEAEALRPLQLAKLAAESYEKAAAVTESNYSRARFQNNLVDLKMTVLRQFTTNGIDFSPVDGGEEAQLRNLLQHQVTREGEGLPEVLRDLSESLARAKSLAKEPHIYVTDAQLGCLTVELINRGLLRPDEFLSLEEAAQRASESLRIAFSLGLDRSFLATGQEAVELGLSCVKSDQHRSH